jgi:hypothetical protein
MTDGRIRCAWHEAGHAAAYHYLGWPIAFVEIREDDTGLTRGLERVDRPLCVAFVCVAGPVAQAKFAGALVDELLQDDAVGRIDLAAARRHLAKVAGDPEVRLRCAIIAARLLVEQQWPLVERIAEALLARGRLDARQLDALFQA